MLSVRTLTLLHSHMYWRKIMEYYKVITMVTLLLVSGDLKKKIQILFENEIKFLRIAAVPTARL